MQLDNAAPSMFAGSSKNRTRLPTDDPPTGTAGQPPDPVRNASSPTPRHRGLVAIPDNNRRSRAAARKRQNQIGPKIQISVQQTLRPHTKNP
jgi:hypothetical protein